MSYTLTFDLGTSYFKVCLFDGRLKLLVAHSDTVPIKSPAEGHRELTVDSFESLLTTAVQTLSSQTGGLRKVKRVCFASQANSFTLFDKHSSPLLPFVIWSDVRASSLSQHLNEISQSDEFYSTTGIAHLDHHFMIAKLRWFQLYSKSILDRVDRVYTLSDYLVWRLTGEFVAEAALAGLTGLVDIHRLTYRSEALKFIGLTADQFPRVLRAGSCVGRIRSEIIRAWGLAEDCQLMMGCLDQYAGAIGAGVTFSSGICETTGTVLSTVRCTNQFIERPAAGVFQGPAFTPKFYYQMVFSSLSAGILERYRNSLIDRPSFVALDRMAADVPSGANGLRLDRNSVQSGKSEMFIGRTDKHSRGHEVRAIMEAVAWELKSQIATLCGKNWPGSIKSVGGAARSKVWQRIKHEIVGCNFECVDVPEPTSYGAARLAHIDDNGLLACPSDVRKS